MTQTSHAYIAKEKPKKSTATQSSISSFVTYGDNFEASNAPQSSPYKNRYNYFGNGYTLRTKYGVHSKIENSSKKRKRSKFLDEFWNSDEEEIEDVCANNSSYNSDNDNNTHHHTRKSSSESIKSYTSKYFAHTSYEEPDDNKIYKNDNHQEELERIHSQNRPEESTVNINEEVEFYEQQSNHEHFNNEEYDDDNAHEYQIENDEQNFENNQPQKVDENEEFYEHDYNDIKDIDHSNDDQSMKEKEIDAKINIEEGPNLFIPTILIENETTADPILISDSENNSQLMASNTNNSVTINNNNPIIIDSSPIRIEHGNYNKKSDINSDIIKDDQAAYFEKIKNATANKRRKIILD